MPDLFYQMPPFLRSRVIIISSIIIVYCALFFTFYSALGNAVATLEIIPVVIIAWSFGLRVGVISSLIIAALNMFILFPMVGVGTAEIQCLARLGRSLPAARLHPCSSRLPPPRRGRQIAGPC